MSTTLSTLSQNQIKIIEGEPRMRDTDLGAVLGMAQPLNIRSKIAENVEELKMYGTIHAARESFTSGNTTVRETTVYYLLEGQALCIVALSRAPNAPAIRKVIIDGFMAARGAGPIVIPPAKSEACEVPDRLTFEDGRAALGALRRLLDEAEEGLHCWQVWAQAGVSSLPGPAMIGRKAGEKIPAARFPDHEKSRPYDSDFRTKRPHSGSPVRTSVRLWIADRLEVAHGERESASTLYRDYLSFCKSGGLPPTTQSMFGRNLAKAGFEKIKSGGFAVYEDVRMREGKNA